MLLEINRYRLPGLEKRFSRQVRNRAFLVVLKTQGRPAGFLEESAAEMQELSRSCGIRIVEQIQAQIPHPSPRHFVREGKLNEIRQRAHRVGANVLVFNVDLSPTQAGNIETFTHIPVVDRTGLILEIFSRRARSREGKLQVELAQLHYTLPRLSGLGTVMSRLGGGIGSRGPGEQELEHDRRKVRLRIQRVKEELEKVRRHRELLRQGRRRKRFVTTALVGYTNAGKSTLLNALTGTHAHVEDKMFATLDPVTRLETFNGRDHMLFVDTVGFLRDLPPTLVESFHATLEEVTEADILIHVLDVAHPMAQEFKKVVEKVLIEIGAGDKPVVLALNKADLLTEEERRRVQGMWPEGILISAKDRLGLNGLIAKLNSAEKGQRSA